MDSTGLLVHLLANGCEVRGISFDYGQKHKVEIERAQLLVWYLKDNLLDVTHRVIKFRGLSQLLNSHLVEGSRGASEDCHPLALGQQRRRSSTARKRCSLLAARPLLDL